MILAHRTKSFPNKILSICWGLLIVSSFLVFLYFFDFLPLDSFLLIDNQFFGKSVEPSYLLGFYLFDITILVLVILFLEKNTRILFIALPWFLFNFTETLFDIYGFKYDFHFVLEELAFLSLYSYLTITCTIVLFMWQITRYQQK